MTSCVLGRTRWPICLLIAILSTTIPLAAKRKDDRLVLRNGDHLVGEIKGLSQGDLQFKPDYVLNTFDVDWSQVHELESQDQFQVVLNDGRHLTGIIARRADGTFTISDPAGAILASVSSNDVISIVQVEASIWAQLTGQINSGLSYTSGDSQVQFSASGSVGYIAERYAFDLSGSSNLSRHSTDAGDSGTSRNAADLLVEFPFAPRWFAGAVASLLNSEQQDLELRTTLGGGVGRWLILTQHVRLAAFGGLVYSHERYSVLSDTGQAEPKVAENLEGIGTLVFKFHRFKTADIESKLTVYPSFTTFGRVRLGVAPTFNFEVARNLYWAFTLYENYDSHPPVNANKNDFGVTNSIGWKF